VTGQDGSYLCEFLLEKGYIVHGVSKKEAREDGREGGHVYIRVAHDSSLTDSPLPLSC